MLQHPNCWQILYTTTKEWDFLWQVVLYKFKIFLCIALAWKKKKFTNIDNSNWLSDKSNYKLFGKRNAHLNEITCRSNNLIIRFLMIAWWTEIITNWDIWYKFKGACLLAETTKNNLELYKFITITFIGNFSALIIFVKFSYWPNWNF